MYKIQISAYMVELENNKNYYKTYNPDIIIPNLKHTMAINYISNQYSITEKIIEVIIKKKKKEKRIDA